MYAVSFFGILFFYCGAEFLINQFWLLSTPPLGCDTGVAIRWLSFGNDSCFSLLLVNDFALRHCSTYLECLFPQIITFDGAWPCVVLYVYITKQYLLHSGSNLVNLGRIMQNGNAPIPCWLNILLRKQACVMQAL